MIVALTSDTGQQADVVIVATLTTDRGIALAPGAQILGKGFTTRLLAALKTVDASGRAEELVKIPTLGLATVPLVLAVGLGKGNPRAPMDPEAVRRAVGTALRSIGTAKRVVIAIGSGTDATLVGAIADGASLGSYRFTKYKSSAKPLALRRVEVAVTDPANSAARVAVRRSKIITTAVNNTRDLINTPANDLNPVTFAKYAHEHGIAAGLSVEVLDERALRRGNYGALLAVGGGSATPPRLVRLSYRPARATSHVALVGKGITFDTGGLDLKHMMMAQMKSDMSGAAAVIEAIIAVAALKLPVSVTATVPMAENAVSGTSYRPSDVLKLHDGRTVEVDNTDAEGRLVLADAILRAIEDNPDYLIETATLTGGQMVALGTRTTGAMGTDAFRDRVVSVGAAAGESLWPMPLPDHLRASLDSPVADIVNVAKDRWASMLVGGVFLQEFVPDSLEWVHLDIAGPSFVSAASGYNQAGGTGAIVRTIIATVADIAERG